MQGGEHILVLPDAGRAERAGKAPLPRGLGQQPDADGAEPQQHGGDVRALRVQLAPGGLEKQLGGRGVRGRGARAGGQAAEQPRIQRGQAAHAGERRVAEDDAGVARQPLPQSLRRKGMQDGHAGKRHRAIKCIRRGHVQPNAGQTQPPDARQQRVGIETFGGEQRNIVFRGCAGIAAQQRELVAERAVPPRREELNAEGGAIRRLAGDERFSRQGQGHFDRLRFARRQKDGQIVHGQRLARAGGARTEDEAPRLHRGERRAEADGLCLRIRPKCDIAQAGARRQMQADRPEHARRTGCVKAQAERLPAPGVQRVGERHAHKAVLGILERAEGHIVRQHAPPAAHQFERQLRVVGAERAEIQRIRQFDRAAHVAGDRGGQGKIGLLHRLRVVRAIGDRRAQQVGKGAQRVRAGEMKGLVGRHIFRQALGQPGRADAPARQRSHAFCRATISRAIIRPQMVLPSQISPRMTISNASSSGRRTRPRNSSSSGCVSP